jgi:hypothetical protein
LRVDKTLQKEILNGNETKDRITDHLRLKNQKHYKHYMGVGGGIKAITRTAFALKNEGINE